MSGLVPFFITGYTGGLQTNKKPYLLPDKAWQRLYNAFCFRERILKRQGNKLLGRLERVLTAQSLGNTPAGPPNTITFSNIFTTLSIPEANAELAIGTLVITVGAPDTAKFTDNGTGGFTVTGAGVAAGSYINYVTGEVVLVFSALTGGSAITAAFGYYPNLPVMGISLREIGVVNDEQTIWFDTTYVYVWSGTNFTEFIAGTTWASTNYNFFWTYNVRGTAPVRLFFVTNFISNAGNPMRYTAGVSWVTFAPLLTAATTLYTAQILITYYGRMLALNTFEGTTVGGAGAAIQYGNRVRFTGLGADPTAATSWRSDMFGLGGFLDAPTNEDIISVSFIKNTLIVKFEQTTWQLRYQGEYGQPYIWERVSADFGSESTFSGVIFDNHDLTIGNKGITASNAGGVDRIDLDIPETIFDFKSSNNGVQRVWGVRDFEREVVFWNYPSALTQAGPATDQTFPNRVLLYNYRNQTWAIFRDSVTAFGTFQNFTDLTWDSQTTTWDDETVTWDDYDTKAYFPSIVSGNQQGFVHFYGYTSQDGPSLTVSAINLTTTPIQLTIVNHNLEGGETIYLTGAQFIDSSTFVPLATNLNNVIYRVKPIDANTIGLVLWSFPTQAYLSNFPFTPVTTATYIGGGLVALFPKLDVITKDINLYQQKGKQTKLSRIDFLMENTPSSAMTVVLNLNSSPSVQGNMLVGNTGISTATPQPFYTPSNDYTWFSFYATLAAQYFNIQITYDDNLMNTLTTHQQGWTLYAINAWTRPGGKIVF